MSATFLIAVLACASPGRDTSPVPPEGSPDDSTAALPVDVFVRSFHVNPVRVFVLRGEARRRLGVVAEGQGQRFRLPRDFHGTAAPVRFLFTLVGADGQFLSTAVTLRAGDEVRWTIPESLRHAQMVIW